MIIISLLVLLVAYLTGHSGLQEKYQNRIPGRHGANVLHAVIFLTRRRYRKHLKYIRQNKCSTQAFAFRGSQKLSPLWLDALLLKRFSLNVYRSLSYMHTIVFIKKNFMKCVRNEIISGISKHVILKYREWLEWAIWKSMKSRQYWKTLLVKTNEHFF